MAEIVSSNAAHANNAKKRAIQPEAKVKHAQRGRPRKRVKHTDVNKAGDGDSPEEYTISGLHEYHEGPFVLIQWQGYKQHAWEPFYQLSNQAKKRAKLLLDKKKIPSNDDDDTTTTADLSTTSSSGYKVEKIVDVRQGPSILVHWDGYEDPTWEPLETILAAFDDEQWSDVYDFLKDTTIYPKLLQDLLSQRQRDSQVGGDIADGLGGDRDRDSNSKPQGVHNAPIANGSKGNSALNTKLRDASQNASGSSGEGFDNSVARSAGVHSNMMTTNRPPKVRPT